MTQIARLTYTRYRLRGLLVLPLLPPNHACIAKGTRGGGGALYSEGFALDANQSIHTVSFFPTLSVSLFLFLFLSRPSFFSPSVSLPARRKLWEKEAVDQSIIMATHNGCTWWQLSLQLPRRCRGLPSTVTSLLQFTPSSCIEAWCMTDQLESRIKGGGGKKRSWSAVATAALKRWMTRETRARWFAQETSARCIKIDAQRHTCWTATPHMSLTLALCRYCIVRLCVCCVQVFDWSRYSLVSKLSPLPFWPPLLPTQCTPFAFATRSFAPFLFTLTIFYSHCKESLLTHLDAHKVHCGESCEIWFKLSDLHQEEVKQCWMGLGCPWSIPQTSIKLLI